MAGILSKLGDRACYIGKKIITYSAEPSFPDVSFVSVIFPGNIALCVGDILKVCRD